MRSLALRVLQLGALAVVLAALPYKAFELDRFFVAKELVLHVVAGLAAALCLTRARRLPLAQVDRLLALFLLLGVVSALFATNWWLAGRAVAVSLSGAACFWAARAVARAGHGRALVAALAFAGVLGALTALVQAYGLETEYMSLNRAPGGTFGNRNFMAHLAVIAAPALLLTAIEARSRGAFARWSIAVGIVAAALIFSRSRAAWLALAVGLAVLLPLAFLALRRSRGEVPWRRALLLVVAAAIGSAAALLLPNTLDWRSDSPYLDTARSVVNYKQGSGHGRLVQYGNTLRMTLHHPLLGVGPGNWAVVYPRFASKGDPSLASDGMTANPWPSSDWMTFLSERGPPAFVLLALAMIALLVDGFRALRGARDAERTAACVLIGTLAVLLVVGSFDAVLLLPVPALVAWSLLGALSPSSAERSTIALPLVRRTVALIAVVALAAAAAARSLTQATAMEIANGTSRLSVAERAAALDPGSYRIHIRLAEAYARRGSCPGARAHASAAHALFPAAAEPRQLLVECATVR